jgi:hypothetical protein
MICHSISIKFKAGISDSDRRRATETLSRMGTEIDVVKSAVIGREHGGDYEYGAMWTFDDTADYRTFMYHPLHLEVDRVGLQLVEKMLSHDITDDPDPQRVFSEIDRIHRERFAEHKDIANLVSGMSSYTGSSAPHNV